MKSYLVPAVLSVAATPALAHGGAHLHPHGLDITAAAAILAAVGAAVAFLLR
ncbi:MAG: peptidase M23 [Rhodobacteraceae bacterium]|nr:peptidase M23 [Paracoccaceae bacterium]